MAHLKYTPKDTARFESKVDRSGGPDACHLWTAGVFAARGGYGAFWDGDRMRGAHCVAWEIANGSNDSDLWVLHSCPGGDNPRCCNPRHLRLGTPAENIADTVARGRHARGECNGLRKHPEKAARGECQGNARLTTGQVAELRRLQRVGAVSAVEWGKRLGVSRSTVADILKGRTWRHVR